MNTLTHPQQFRGIAAYNLHRFDIVHNNTPTTCYDSASNSPTRGEHKNPRWQPHIILNHKSVILSLQFRRIYIVRGRDNLCSMPYNDIFADHYGVSSIQTISLYRRMRPPLPRLRSSYVPRLPRKLLPPQFLLRFDEHANTLCFEEGE